MIICVLKSFEWCNNPPMFWMWICYYQRSSHRPRKVIGAAVDTQAKWALGRKWIWGRYSKEIWQHLVLVVLFFLSFHKSTWYTVLVHLWVNNKNGSYESSIPKVKRKKKKYRMTVIESHWNNCIIMLCVAVNLGGMKMRHWGRYDKNMQRWYKVRIPEWGSGKT